MPGRTRANGEGSIFPYRNGYAAYVWVDKPDGKRDRKYVYGQTREIVHEKWLKLHHQAKAGPVATRVPTLARYLGYWLEEIVKPNLAPATYVSYEGFTRLYIVPGIGAKRLDRLQVKDVQTWINKVARTCQCCAQGKDAARPPAKRRCCALGACCNAVPSDSAIKGLRATLRAALSQAVTEELVSKNVAALVKLRATRKRPGTAWDSDEARRFLEAARADSDPMYAAWVLLLVLGLRRGELLGLAWDDIDQAAGELNVSWQLQRIGGQLVRRETKTAESDASMPLPEICRTALAIRRAEQAADRKAAGEVWQKSPLVFTTRFGTPIEPRNFNRAWEARIRRYGLREITPHGARRTCASILADLDVHPRVAMQILRHADFKVTMEIYTRVSSKQTREALKRLGDRMNGTESA
ncbi:tyrosine-type recombinase/integrase [Micromonospora marina]|uniref:tyrosine-type recombinase/integrase n=1 Tax=Micromonospora marina TaxID=307120 RepID=UPI003D761F24